MSDEYSDDAFNEEDEINEAVGELLTAALEQDIKKFIHQDGVDPRVVSRTLAAVTTATAARHVGVKFTARLLRHYADWVERKGKELVN